MGLLDKLKKKKDNISQKAAPKKAVASGTKNEKSNKEIKTEEILEKKTKSTTSPKVDSSTKTKAKVKKVSGNAYKVLLRPIVSEKALTGEGNGSYTFEVLRETNKIEIKKAIYQVYGVLPKLVRVMNMDGKEVRFGKTKGRRKGWKKAIVTLPKGKTINIHEGV